MTPRAVLPKCGSPDRPSARMSTLRCFDTKPGLLTRELYAVGELDARPRVLAQEEVAVEVDVVHQARDVRAGGDAEARLDHAAEHHTEAERAGGMHHADRFADAARLCELDVDAVCALRAGGDVGERVAVLVDVDRERRATLQLGP